MNTMPSARRHTSLDRSCGRWKDTHRVLGIQPTAAAGESVARARHPRWVTRAQVAVLCLALGVGLVGCSRQEPYQVGAVQIATSATGEASIPPSRLNPDWKRRDAILGISVDWEARDSGTFPLETVDLATLEKLLDGKFIDPADQQNEAPTVSEIARFMRAHPGTVGFGYAVSPARPDYRVSIEGISIAHDKITDRTRDAAASLCHDADEAVFEPDIHCWWD